MYSHLRLVIAASLIAFGSVIAVGVPALFLTVDRPLVARAEISDLPGDPACRQRTWLNLDRNCLSRRDLPWVAGPGRSNAGRLELRSDTATPAVQESGGGTQHAATLPPQEFLLQEPMRQDATRPEPTRPELEAQEPARHEPVPQASPTQASILRDAAPKAALLQEAPPDNSASQLFTPQELTPRELAPQETAPQQPTPEGPVQHSNVAAPGRAAPAQRPVAREPRVTKPAAGGQTRLPASKTAARGERTAKRPANEALSTVRKFGEHLPEISHRLLCRGWLASQNRHPPDVDPGCVLLFCAAVARLNRCRIPATCGSGDQNRRGSDRNALVQGRGFIIEAEAVVWPRVRRRKLVSRMTATFETALAARVEAMADACTRCGKCVEVCPVTGPGGVNAEPVAVICGIIDILRTGDGPEASRKWANACVLTGECIKACDYGVNPRFMLGMARVAMARHRDEPPQRRRQGVDGFRKVAREVTHISQMQLDDELLTRLGQKPGGNADARDPARLRVLHRLQRAQNATYRAPCARHHGYARRDLSGPGRPDVIAAGSCRCALRTSPRPAASPKPPWTSSRAARPGKWCRGARAATRNSPRRPCRRSRRRAARSRSR